VGRFDARKRHGWKLYPQPAVQGVRPWLLYFPAVVFTAMYAGLWPSLFVLLGATLMGVQFFMEPLGVLWPLPRTTDLISAMLFFLAASTMAAVVVWNRRLLRTSQEDKLRLDLALATGQMAAWSWNVQSGELSLSNNASKLFGATWSNVNEWLALVHPADRERVQTLTQEALKTADEYSFVARMQRPDRNETCWLQTRGHVHRDEYGQAVHVSGVTADVTELMSAQEQLRLDSQRKDVFLATLAHELRNPLAPIRYSTSMLRDDATSAQRETAREVIMRQSGQMARLLDELLDMSRVTRDVIELKLESIDMRTAIAYACESVRGPYAERRHQLNVHVPAQAVPVRGDAARIHQVLENLLDNAAKYTPDGGHISVGLERNDQYAIVRVTDNGIGIEQRHLSEVFELFTQVHQAGRSPGLGIGLAVVKRLVELHGGTIAAESKGPGFGTTFTVSLPLGEPELAPASIEPVTPRPVCSSELVLVVDDNRDTADIVATVLEMEGYRTSVAYTGASAMALFDQVDPVAVLLDLGLPDVSGIEVARHIRSKANGRPVLIAVTGWNEQQAKTPDGFDLHLVKPVDPDQLLKHLSQLLGARASTSRSES
jgi:signal transduction histidine kinase/ActR/RegA family two-component response regulator